MRYLVMHKVDANMEAGGPPSQEIIRGMGQLIGESLKAGRFLDGAGLHRSAKRVRLRCAGGDCSVTHGPLAGENELVARFAMIKCRSMDDAVEHARRLAAAAGDVEIEIGPVVESWDLTGRPKPADVLDSRFLLLFKSDAASEAGAQPPALDALIADLTAAGVILTAQTITPSSRATRLPSAAKGKRAWIDGPFAESKELIAGFSIIEVPSKEDAISWADRYAAVLGDNEVDVRPLG